MNMKKKKFSTFFFTEDCCKKKFNSIFFLFLFYLLVPFTPATDMTAGPIASNISSQTNLATDLNSSPVDFDLSDLGFFENLTGLEEPGDEDIDMAEIDDMFRTIQSAGASLLEPIMELGQSMLNTFISVTGRVLIAIVVYHGPA